MAIPTQLALTQELDTKIQNPAARRFADAERQKVAGQDEDATLVLAAKCGDGHAFEVLIRRYQRRTLAVVRRFTRTQSGSESLFDQLLSPITGMDLEEIHRFARYLPVLVLVPRSTAANQVVPQKLPTAKSSNERSQATELLGVLGKAVQHFKRASGESTVAFGNVRVDFCAMEALRQGEPVLLTTKEFRTLEYLVQNAPRVISRDELLNEVWGYENYPCTRTVDNHILRLRQKLENDPSRPAHIRTMHGAGYKFLP